jgi:hypothetical protein
MKSGKFDISGRSHQIFRLLVEVVTVLFCAFEVMWTHVGNDNRRVFFAIKSGDENALLGALWR